MNNELNRQLKKYTYREEQKVAFQKFKDEIDNKTDNKFFLYELPTGIGKSVLTMMLSDFLIERYGDNTKIDILTSSKLLQKQYKDEFHFLSNLWGKSEYKCKQLDNAYSCADAVDILSATKQKCTSCKYVVDREIYRESQLSLTNYHMYCTLGKYTQMYKDRKAKFLILDEAHELEQIISDMYSFDITETIIKKYLLGEAVEESIANSLKQTNSIDELYTYIKDTLLPTLEEKISAIMQKISENGELFELDLKINNFKGNSEDSYMLEVIKMVSDGSTFNGKLQQFINDYEKNKSNWVLDVSTSKKNSYVYSVQPVWASEYIKNLIWDKYDKIILLSGTVLNKDMFCYLNGIDTERCFYHSIESPFPIKNRPIFYIPIGRLSYKSKEETFAEMKPFINKLLTKYKNKKGIIHTHSFEFSEKIRESFNMNKRLLFHDNKNKNETLKTHYMTSEPTVLVSPSMTTGIDLQNDRARFQIILKVPYPSLASSKNKTRMSTNSKWYAYKTITTIIQTYGRAVRSNVDYADCIILDECFSDLIRNAHEFIPNYISNAIEQYNYKTL